MTSILFHIGNFVLNYNFRNATTDIDVALSSASGIKDAILQVAEIFNLPEDWMNNDFKYLSSYSTKLPEISKHYAALNNGSLEIRTVDAEYLIAMKMKSGRAHGNDFSDIVGIIYSEKEKGNDISINQIKYAVNYLYEDISAIEKHIYDFVKECCELSIDDLKIKYYETVERSSVIKSQILEQKNKEQLVLTKQTAKSLSNRIMRDLIKTDIKSKQKESERENGKEIKTVDQERNGSQDER